MNNNFDGHFPSNLVLNWQFWIRSKLAKVWFFYRLIFRNKKMCQKIFILMQNLVFWFIKNHSKFTKDWCILSFRVKFDDLKFLSSWVKIIQMAFLLIIYKSNTYHQVKICSFSMKSKWIYIFCLNIIQINFWPMLVLLCFHVWLKNWIDEFFVTASNQEKYPKNP